LQQTTNALYAPAHAHQEAYDGPDQEHDEQHFRDAGGAHGDPTESEEGRNQRDNKKYDCIVKHEHTYYVWGLELPYWPQVSSLRRD
jgi:hypothetical protein